MKNLIRFKAVLILKLFVFGSLHSQSIESRLILKEGNNSFKKGDFFHIFRIFLSKQLISIVSLFLKLLIKLLTPITAGIFNSSHLIAICELGPPYFVINPAIL